MWIKKIERQILVFEYSQLMMNHSNNEWIEAIEREVRRDIFDNTSIHKFRGRMTYDVFRG